MRVGLITPRPDHPLLAAAAALLSPRHTVTVLDPQAGDAAAPCEAQAYGQLADVYLLKARTPQALALARAVEERGATVLNSSAATAFCQDRTGMAERARQAGLPFARTRTVAALRQLAEEPQVTFPVVVKSRHSRRGDLVARVDDAAGLRALCGHWAEEPVVVQPFTANDGWDHKVWVIAGRLFAARRRSELAEPATTDRDTHPTGHTLPQSWAEKVLAVGRLFCLDVYGVDIVAGHDGCPVMVDVNAFPGLRGQPGAPAALAELVLRAGAHRPPVRGKTGLEPA